MIIGQPGAGKSTLARDLGALTGLPVVHVDHIHHLPRWKERPRAEKIAMALESHAEPEWIFEGSLSATYDVRMSRADTLIVLDFPLWLRLWRVIMRTVKYYGRRRPDMAEGCHEAFHFDFYKWIWDTRHTARRKNLALAEKAPADTDVYILTNVAEVQAYLANMNDRALPA